MSDFIMLTERFLAVLIIFIVFALLLSGCGEASQHVTVVQEQDVVMVEEDAPKECIDVSNCKMYLNKRGHRVFKCGK